MLLLLNPLRDLFPVSHPEVTEDLGHTNHFTDPVLGFLPRQTWPGHAPESPGKKFDFLPLVTGHWYSYRKPKLTEVLVTYCILS
jgi:hypothetical protein